MLKGHFCTLDGLRSGWRRLAVTSPVCARRAKRLWWFRHQSRLTGIMDEDGNLDPIRDVQLGEQA
jgi:hypothetical protein